jgi:hypothetical protein
MEIKKVHDRGDGVLKVTIPADSDIEEGDYVKLTRVEENEDAELTDDAVDSAPEISIPSPPLLARRNGSRPRRSLMRCRTRLQTVTVTHNVRNRGA